MISELRFSRSYSSIWHVLAPTMELFVRKANSILSKKNWDGLAAKSPAASRSLINRVAFKMLEQAVSVTSTYEERVKYLEQKSNAALAEEALTGVRLLGSNSLLEASLLSRRMCDFLFNQGLISVRLSPWFPGCGIINGCYGDAITDDDDIIELKDGDRPFRAYDLRQMSVYAALHLSSTGRLPKNLLLANSRRGFSLEFSLDELANEVAGQAGVDYLREIIRTMSDLTIY